MVWLALENRRVLGRMVRELVRLGIRQFLDLGTGLPTQGHVHQVLAELGVADECRVVYVDDNPVAATHGAAYIGRANAALLCEESCSPQRVLDHPEARELLDFGMPIGVLMFAVLHFLPDGDDPAGVIGAYLSRMVAGSYPAHTHVTNEFQDRSRTLEAIYARANHGFHARSPYKIASLAIDNHLDITGDGIVRVTHWKAPDALRPPPSQMRLFGGLAKKEIGLTPVSTTPAAMPGHEPLTSGRG
jgi:S-adenosyl methyltransferase